MATNQRNEKDEKDEKQQEKDEKERQEKWRRDPVGAVVWAAILIWAGIVLLAGNLGISPFLLDGNLWWSIILAGAGAIILLGAVYRLLVPAYRRPILGELILGAVLLGIGLGNIFGTSIFWPVALIIAGLAILLRGLVRRR